MQIAVTSQSRIKVECIKGMFPTWNVRGFLCKNDALPDQPIGTADQCAKIRADCVEGDYDLLISVENGIRVVDDDTIEDYCAVYMFSKSSCVNACVESPISIPVDKKYLDIAENRASEKNSLGINYTVGRVIAEKLQCNHQNWMRKFGTDRTVQMAKGIISCAEQMLRNGVIKINDFPKPGVLFQDMSQILADKVLNQLLFMQIFHDVKHIADKFDKVVALDSRGYIYGAPIAERFRKGFVMVRKAGKTPGNTIVEEYATEYSTAKVEIMAGMIKPGDKVLIVDDLIATGGSLVAAQNLVEKMGGIVVRCAVVLKVKELFHDAVKALGHPPYVVIH